MHSDIDGIRSVGCLWDKAMRRPLGQDAATDMRGQHRAAASAVHKMTTTDPFSTAGKAAIRRPATGQGRGRSTGPPDKRRRQDADHGDPPPDADADLER
eukprot:8831796-Pyramimonas_sp.AAC.1